MTDTETAEAEAVTRSQMYKHEDAYDWLMSEGKISEESTGPEIIAAFAANRNAYRRTERYASLVAAGDPNKASAEAAKEAKRLEREQAKATKAAEREATKAAKAEAKKVADAEKAAKAAAAAKPAEPEKATKPAAKVPAKATKKAAASAPAGDDPFA